MELQSTVNIFAKNYEFTCKAMFLGAQNSLTLMYEHKLKRSAANMVIGPFGGSANRDFICIQSLDGMLLFYEQECFAFCCFLPNFLIPGPLIFNKRTDSFITFSSKWCIESYM